MEIAPLDNRASERWDRLVAMRDLETKVSGGFHHEEALPDPRLRLVGRGPAIQEHFPDFSGTQRDTHGFAAICFADECFLDSRPRVAEREIFQLDAGVRPIGGETGSDLDEAVQQVEADAKKSLDNQAQIHA